MMPQPAAAPPSFPCPFCGAAAVPTSGAVTCQACGKSFVLAAGPALNGLVTPPAPAADADVIQVVSPSPVMPKHAQVTPVGVGEWAMDPVVGMVAASQQFSTFQDIAVVSAWRKIGWGAVLVGALVPAPLALFFLFATVYILSLIAKVGAKVGHFVFSGITLLIAGLLVWGAYSLIHRGLVVRAWHVRIWSRAGELSFRCDQPASRRKRFFQELLRRTGIEPIDIP